MQKTLIASGANKMPKTDPKILKRLHDERWITAGDDPEAVDILHARLLETARKKTVITYSELVRNVRFTVNGKPYFIETSNWTGHDQMLIGDYLGFISVQTYSEYGFMASALAIGVVENLPSERFFTFMRKVGALSSMSESAKLRFWSEQVALAHEHWAHGEPLPSASDFFQFIREGERVQISGSTRTRCQALVERVKARLRSNSRDGLIHCENCGWSNPDPERFRGDIVEIHHRTPLAAVPDEGITLDFETAFNSLVPLCPNCHRLVHARGGNTFYTLEELKVFSAK